MVEKSNILQPKCPKPRKTVTEAQRRAGNWNWLKYYRVMPAFHSMQAAARSELVSAEQRKLANDAANAVYLLYRSMKQRPGILEDKHDEESTGTAGYTASAPRLSKED